MRPPLPPLLLLVGLVVLPGCGSGASPGHDPAPETGEVTLEIATQDWSGWSEEPPGDPEVTTVELAEGDSTTVDVLIGELEITVVAIDDDTIELGTNEEMALDTASGGWDYSDAATEFVLDRSGDLSIATPTFDAGTTVTISEVA